MINKVATNFLEPFHNPSTFRLMSWFYWPLITKSITELNTLVQDVILAPDFDAQELVGFDAAKEHKIMDFYQVNSLDGPTPFSFNDTWLEGSIEIPLPCDGVNFPSEADAPNFTVKFHYRKIMEVLKAALTEQSVTFSHLKHIGSCHQMNLKNEFIPRFSQAILGTPNSRGFSMMFKMGKLLHWSGLSLDY